jgi:hypothetical protein
MTVKLMMWLNGMKPTEECFLVLNSIVRIFGCSYGEEIQKDSIYVLKNFSIYIANICTPSVLKTEGVVKKTQQNQWYPCLHHPYHNSIM